MNMTKRDVADIVLIFIAVSFIMALITSVVTLGSYIGMTQEALKYSDKHTAIGFQIITVIVLLLINYLLLFKRSRILSLLFPDGKDKELNIPSGLEALTQYAFWVRLLGIFTFLSSVVGFFSRFVMDISYNQDFMNPSFWWHNTGVEFISMIMGIIIIYKAEWIAEKLGKKR